MYEDLDVLVFLYMANVLVLLYLLLYLGTKQKLHNKVIGEQCILLILTHPNSRVPPGSA